MKNIILNEWKKKYRSTTFFYLNVFFILSLLIVVYLGILQNNNQEKYYISTNNYKIFMDAQQKINLAIVNQFELSEIDFAFPTRTIHLTRSIQN